MIGKQDIDLNFPIEDYETTDSQLKHINYQNDAVNVFLIVLMTLYDC